MIFFIRYVQNSVAYTFLIFKCENNIVEPNKITKTKNGSFFEKILPLKTPKEQGPRLSKEPTDDDHNNACDSAPRRSKRMRKEKKFSDGFYFLLINNDPLSHKEAIRLPNAPFWKEGSN